MVEFGLKLEDNKVSEWGEHYLDYEALKKILKNAKKIQKKYEETCQENPAEAEEVTKAYRSGAYAGMKNSLSMQSFSSATTKTTAQNQEKEPIASADHSRHRSDSVHNSIQHLETIRSERDAEKLDVGVDVDEEIGHASEQTALLKRRGSHDAFNIKSLTSTERTIKHTISQLTLSNLFSTSSKDSIEQKVRNHLVDIDTQTNAFDVLCYKQLKKVVSFYYSQLQELQGRLEYMVESVARSQGIGKASNNGDDGIIDGTEEGADAVSSELGGAILSPFPSHRKQRSSVGQKVEELILQLTDSVRSVGKDNDNNKTNRNEIILKARRRATGIRMGKILKATDKDNINVTGATDEDYEDDPDWDEARIAEAESIKRSLVDQYRVAKLLHNYAMMNITGFVKIIKKFDKTVPSEKGRFKSVLETRNMLNDAKAVEKLSNKYEKYYADWFCHGDIREAKAQMLTKRGDGLDMDWSQLQLGYRMGMCAILALWVCWDMIWGMIEDGKTTIGAREAFPVFRACGGLLLLQWFWGCSVFMWTRYRVNYIFLFDFNPRIISTPIGIIADAVDNTLIYLCLMLVS